mgnify:CR=1 FL=1
MITLEPTEEQLEQLNELEELMTKSKSKTYTKAHPHLTTDLPKRVKITVNGVEDYIEIYR